MDLGNYAESLAYEIAFWMEGLLSSDYPIEEIGRLSIEISTKFRALAIIGLLANGDSDLFYHNLNRSGQVREKYLQRVTRSKKNDDHHFVSGRYEPLLDVIAANNFDLTKRIGKLVPSSWSPDREYEDDYYYSKILDQLIRKRDSKESIKKLFERYNEWLAGETHDRFEVCNAIADKNQTAFDLAFNGIIAEREIQIEKDKARGELEDHVVIAQRKVYIEGLALLRLAQFNGLQTQSEYQYCPSIARIPMRTPFPVE
jgi:hypothetical protein